MSEVYWKIVFSKSEGLAVACMQDFDERDYRIAVSKRFNSEAEAEFAVLALRNITDPVTMLEAVRKLESY